MLQGELYYKWFILYVEESAHKDRKGSWCSERGTVAGARCLLCGLDLLCKHQSLIGGGALFLEVSGRKREWDLIEMDEMGLKVRSTLELHSLAHTRNLCRKEGWRRPTGHRAHTVPFYAHLRSII